MIDPDNVPDVEDSEWLARYVLQSSHYRKSDRTVKPDLFIPHPYQDLSVTRHRDATETELWRVGQNVADTIGKNLHGRADIQAKDCQEGSLQVVKKPLASNSNHADIEGWPSDKKDQKALALKLAAAASQLIPPTQTC
jgi:hypothetical protein